MAPPKLIWLLTEGSDNVTVELGEKSLFTVIA